MRKNRNTLVPRKSRKTLFESNYFARARERLKRELSRIEPSLVQLVRRDSYFRKEIEKLIARRRKIDATQPTDCEMLFALLKTQLKFSSPKGWPEIWGWFMETEGICPRKGRGRPLGNGHPKRKLQPSTIFSVNDIKRLEKNGLDEKDLRILFDTTRNRTLKQIGQSLHISPQAVHKRWKQRILPALKKVNPKFSVGSFKLAVRDAN